MYSRGMPCGAYLRMNDLKLVHIKILRALVQYPLQYNIKQHVIIAHTTGTNTSPAVHHFATACRLHRLEVPRATTYNSRGKVPVQQHTVSAKTKQR
jgi:hypothetical protein